MNLPFVLLTAITVSIDSFVAGFSLSLNKRKSLMLPLTVAIVTYWMCLIAGWAGSLLRPLLQNYVKYIGAIILFALGLSNLAKKEDSEMQQIGFSKCIAIGVGVGLDGAAADLSLVMQGIGDTVFLPILFALTHFVTVFIGQRLAQFAKPKKSNILSALLFLMLGTIKLFD